MDGRQALYRVHYEGPAGRGGLRLIERWASPGRFQLVADDVLGRALWSLDYDSGAGSTVIDHRARRYCVESGDVRVPEVALAPLPLAALPRVLDGELPVASPTNGERRRWTDPSGRVWSARFGADGLEAWTLWQDGEPQLWFTPAPRGGVLSHRQGSQFRWRRVVDEPLSVLAALQPPAGYDAGDCAAGLALTPPEADAAAPGPPESRVYFPPPPWRPRRALQAE